MTKHDIHFIWTGPAPPDWVSSNVARARELHPGRKVHLHDEQVLWDDWQPYYENQHIIAKADLLKLSAARKYSGWVIDCDVWFLRPLDVFESLRGPMSGWWGTAAMGYFGADDTFDWQKLDTLIPGLPVKRNALYDLMYQWASWCHGGLFRECVPEATLVIPAAKESGLYYRLMNDMVTSIGTRIMLHGHRNTKRILDSSIL